jgi:superoxide dismutase, Fe-Mn family
MQRREFLAGSLAAGAGLLLTAGQTSAARRRITTRKGDRKMPFQQPPLPFAMTAMKPFLSEEQLMYHYSKHHAAYFKNLNGLVEGKPEANMTLREVVEKSPAGPVFNNAAQAWNHSFYWDCMKPGGGGEPNGELAVAIRRDFGSFEAFKKAMSEASVKVFGSGWGWLAADKQGKLEIMALSNADTPLKHGKEPVLTIDVWEHAYYVDYHNERPKYVDGFWNVVNWPFVAKCYAGAKG